MDGRTRCRLLTCSVGVLLGSLVLSGCEAKRQPPPGSFKSALNEYACSLADHFRLEEGQSGLFVADKTIQHALTPQTIAHLKSRGWVPPSQDTKVTRPVLFMRPDHHTASPKGVIRLQTGCQRGPLDGRGWYCEFRYEQGRWQFVDVGNWVS